MTTIGVDQGVVDELVAGLLAFTAAEPAERRAAIVELTDRGWSATRIAQHLGTTDRTVYRARSHARQEADAGPPPRGRRRDG